jgi:hypothetical protein
MPGGKTYSDILIYSDPFDWLLEFDVPIADFRLNLKVWLGIVSATRFGKAVQSLLSCK